LRTLVFGSSLTLTLVLTAACGGDGGSAIPSPCNPLGGASCMMPWPSSAYLVEDGATATGFRVDIPAAAMPVNGNDIAVAVDYYNRWDGFSPSGAIVAAFPGGVSATGLPPIDDPAASLGAGSPIVLVDIDTGERAPFFAEVDMNVEDPALRTLIIRPVQRLDPKARYAVGITTAVQAADGGDLPISDAFAALRDGRGYDHPLMERLAPRYDAIFAALDAEGVSRDDLVLAWDFVTASDELLTADLLSMRADALAAMGPAGANLSFDLVEQPPSNPDLVHALYTGTLTSPDFLTDAERDDSVLRRGADGTPALDGMRAANLTAIVPRCVETATLPIPVMIFGHGLFGSGQGYLNDHLLQQVAQDYCFVVLAGDWIGLTDRQIGVAAVAANDLNTADRITEKLAQSVIDFIAIEQASRGPLHAAPQLAYNGAPIIDPSRVYYFGASLGGIMGTSFMAYDPYVTRGVLGVPGGPWSLLFERSFAWNALQGPAHASYSDPANFQILVSLLAMRFEPYDPITAAPHVLANNFPDTPQKQILMYEALGDCLVANITSETLSRTMGLPVVMPSLKVPYGMTSLTGDGPNGFAIYDESPDPLPSPYNVPPEDDNGTHAGVHDRPAVLRQIKAFLYDGIAIDACGGDTPVACACATGACE